MTMKRGMYCYCRGEEVVPILIQIFVIVNRERERERERGGAS